MAIFAIIGAVTAAVELTTAIIEATDDDSADDVLARLRLMDDAINKRLDEIGQAINELTTVIELGFDTEALLNARISARTAMDQLYNYKDLDDMGFLYEAASYASLAKNSMLEHDKVFFIGGLILSGNAYIDVTRELDPDFANDASRIGEISKLANHLESMIQNIEQRIPGHHTVFEREVTDPLDVNEPGYNVPPQIRKEMVYQCYGHDVKAFVFRCSGTACQIVNEHSKPEATRLANSARNNGITGEKATLGVPQFRQTLELWRSLIVQTQRRYVYQRLLGRKESYMDAQRANRRYFQVSQEVIRRVQKTGEDKGKEKLEMTLNVDARPFIVDVLTSTEFKTKILRKLDKDAVVAQVIKRVFSRAPKQTEIAKLRKVEDELGYDGLIAGVIYGKDYAKQFGTGVPVTISKKQPGRIPGTPSRRPREVSTEDA